jgi:hypothetical protein
VTAAAAAGGVAVAALSSGTNENLTVDAKGSGTFTVQGTATGNFRTGRNFVPTANDGASLGVSGTAFSDMFLADGGVINFSAGNATIAHSTNLFTFNRALAVTGNVSPTSDGAGNLGSTGLKWGQLHLNASGVINFNNGNMTITHSAGVLAVAGGTLATPIIRINSASSIANEPGTVANTGPGNQVFGVSGNDRGIVFLTTNTTGFFANFFQGTTGNHVGNIAFTTTATTFNTSSDKRLKEDGRPIEDALAVLKTLEVWNFRWKASGARAHGVFAQDAQKVYPQAVTHDEATDTWVVDNSKFVPLLIAGFQALLKRVEELEAARA